MDVLSRRALVLADGKGLAWREQPFTDKFRNTVALVGWARVPGCGRFALLLWNRNAQRSCGVGAGIANDGAEFAGLSINTFEDHGKAYVQRFRHRLIRDVDRDPIRATRIRNAVHHHDVESSLHPGAI